MPYMPYMPPAAADPAGTDPEVAPQRRGFHPAIVILSALGVAALLTLAAYLGVQSQRPDEVDSGRLSCELRELSGDSC